jgi:hypothetical protein
LATPEARAAAQRFARFVARVPEVGQWAPLAVEYVRGREADPGPTAAERVQALIEEAVVMGAGRGAWLAYALALCGDAVGVEEREALYATAAQAGFPLVRLLLMGGEGGHRVMDPAQAIVDEKVGRLTIGYKKALARRPDADMMERLAVDGEPSVIAVMLANPRLTEALVVRMVARRPCRGEVLAVVARASRWLVRAEVQRALTLNPYTPMRVAFALAPLLVPGELKALGSDGNVHPGLRRFAEDLLDLRTALKVTATSPSELAPTLDA